MKKPKKITLSIFVVIFSLIGTTQVGLAMPTATGKFKLPKSSIEETSEKRHLSERFDEKLDKREYTKITLQKIRVFVDTTSSDFSNAFVKVIDARGEKFLEATFEDVRETETSELLECLDEALLQDGQISLEDLGYEKSNFIHSPISIDTLKEILKIFEDHKNARDKNPSLITKETKSKLETLFGEVEKNWTQKVSARFVNPESFWKESLQTWGIDNMVHDNPITQARTFSLLEKLLENQKIAAQEKKDLFQYFTLFSEEHSALQDIIEKRLTATVPMEHNAPWITISYLSSFATDYLGQFLSRKFSDNFQGYSLKTVRLQGKERASSARNFQNIAEQAQDFLEKKEKEELDEIKILMTPPENHEEHVWKNWATGFFSYLDWPADSEQISNYALEIKNNLNQTQFLANQLLESQEKNSISKFISAFSSLKQEIEKLKNVFSNASTNDQDQAITLSHYIKTEHTALRSMKEAHSKLVQNRALKANLNQAWMEFINKQPIQHEVHISQHVFSDNQNIPSSPSPLIVLAHTEPMQQSPSYHKEDPRVTQAKTKWLELSHLIAESNPNKILCTTIAENANELAEAFEEISSLIPFKLAGTMMRAFSNALKFKSGDNKRFIDSVVKTALEISNNLKENPISQAEWLGDIVNADPLPLGEKKITALKSNNETLPGIRPNQPDRSLSNKESYWRSVTSKASQEEENRLLAQKAQKNNELSKLHDSKRATSQLAIRRNLEEEKDLKGKQLNSRYERYNQALTHISVQEKFLQSETNPTLRKTLKEDIEKSKKENNTSNGIKIIREEITKIETEISKHVPPDNARKNRRPSSSTGNQHLKKPDDEASLSRSDSFSSLKSCELEKILDSISENNVTESTLDLKPSDDEKEQGLNQNCEEINSLQLRDEVFKELATHDLELGAKSTQQGVISEHTRPAIPASTEVTSKSSNDADKNEIDQLLQNIIAKIESAHEAQPSFLKESEISESISKTSGLDRKTSSPIQDPFSLQIDEKLLDLTIQNNPLLPTIEELLKIAPTNESHDSLVKKEEQDEKKFDSFSKNNLFDASSQPQRSVHVATEAPPVIIEFFNLEPMPSDEKIIENAELIQKRLEDLNKKVDAVEALNTSSEEAHPQIGIYLAARKREIESLKKIQQLLKRDVITTFEGARHDIVMLQLRLRKYFSDLAEKCFLTDPDILNHSFSVSENSFSSCQNAEACFEKAIEARPEERSYVTECWRRAFEEYNLACENYILACNFFLEAKMEEGTIADNAATSFAEAAKYALTIAEKAELFTDLETKLGDFKEEVKWQQKYLDLCHHLGIALKASNLDEAKRYEELKQKLDLSKTYLEKANSLKRHVTLGRLATHFSCLWHDVREDYLMSPSDSWNKKAFDVLKRGTDYLFDQYENALLYYQLSAEHYLQSNSQEGEYYETIADSLLNLLYQSRYFDHKKHTYNSSLASTEHAEQKDCWEKASKYANLIIPHWESALTSFKTNIEEYLSHSLDIRSSKLRDFTQNYDNAITQTNPNKKKMASYEEAGGYFQNASTLRKESLKPNKVSTNTRECIECWEKAATNLKQSLDNAESTPPQIEQKDNYLLPCADRAKYYAKAAQCFSNAHEIEQQDLKNQNHSGESKQFWEQAGKRAKQFAEIVTSGPGRPINLKFFENSINTLESLAEFLKDLSVVQKNRSFLKIFKNLFSHSNKEAFLQSVTNYHKKFSDLWYNLALNSKKTILSENDIQSVFENGKKNFVIVKEYSFLPSCKKDFLTKFKTLETQRTALANYGLELATFWADLAEKSMYSTESASPALVNFFSNKPIDTFKASETDPIEAWKRSANIFEKLLNYSISLENLKCLRAKIENTFLHSFSFFSEKKIDDPNDQTKPLENEMKEQLSTTDHLIQQHYLNAHLPR